MRGYMLDTNIFNRLVDGDIDAPRVTDQAVCYATHIQLNELQRTGQGERRQQLLSTFSAVGPTQIPTESAVWGVSEWGEANWTLDDNLYHPIVTALNRKNGGKANNVSDALIAETAIRNSLILVTEDRDLASIMAQHGGSVIDLASFLQEVTCSKVQSGDNTSI